ncbi:ABC-type antimicrobial peptide transport system, permease component [Parapedobacter luteus]|uniref:ABC-type antimicrobial peptide transport system, permease component n=1 Tax=Parapedobacter luteus TaxID=623280 RepID=A0A1T5EAQ4_9SPHI|nr:ABC transporter permease [Parapedobacter luteus]SKB81097.1 ABC-type antimicrobial peptide transport system, permease component [Parapedobacter luteus]
MIKNYFKIAWRNILRQRTNSLIHLLGLSVGMTAAFFIFMWVSNEYSYDRYHADAGCIYRLTAHDKKHRTNDALTPYIWGDEVLGQLDEVEAYTRFRPFVWPNIARGDELFKENAAVYVDAHWFGFFQYDFLAGSAASFNAQPHSLILTASAARKYLGTTEAAVGQTLLVNDVPYTVQGVVKDAPTNSSFRYDLYMPVAARHTDRHWRAWDLEHRRDGNIYCTFVKLSAKVPPENLARKVTAMAPGTWAERYALSLLPLKDMHFEDGTGRIELQQGNRQMTNILLLLGIVLLMVASINYVNLTTAQATIRAREVGIKKIVGAGRWHLFMQFVAETLLVGGLALFAALVMTWALLPFFNRITGLQFVLSILDPLLWMLYGGTLLATLSMASIYPALMLSAFRPLATLRGNSLGSLKGNALRKALVVAQFSIAIALMVSTLVIYQQMRFIDKQYDHYDKTQVFSFLFQRGGNMGPSEKWSLFENIRQELLSHSSIADAAISSGNDIVNMRNTWSGFDWDGRDENRVYDITFFQIGSTLDKFYQLSLKAGRWFLPDSPEDARNFVLNETAVRQLGIREPIIGQRFSLDNDTGTVIGVVADFHYMSAREKIGPAVFGNNPFYANAFAVKSAPGRQADAIAAAETVFKRHLPNQPFDYHFVSEEFEQVYREDFKAATLISGFSLLAIFVSCLGLYGLALFSAERRHKEIGIRKVLGASVSGIVGLLSKDFVKLVLIAVVIASPIAWWAMNNWLEDFAYRIEMEWWMFAAAGLVAVVIALLTVSWQAIRAAVANPVESLRDE